VRAWWLFVVRSNSRDGHPIGFGQMSFTSRSTQVQKCPQRIQSECIFHAIFVCILITRLTTTYVFYSIYHIRTSWFIFGKIDNYKLKNKTFYIYRRIFKNQT